jgi:hypothetical protein
MVSDGHAGGMAPEREWSAQGIRASRLAPAPFFDPGGFAPRTPQAVLAALALKAS